MRVYQTRKDSAHLPLIALHVAPASPNHADNVDVVSSLACVSKIHLAGLARLRERCGRGKADGLALCFSIPCAHLQHGRDGPRNGAHIQVLDLLLNFDLLKVSTHLPARRMRVKAEGV